MITGNHVKLVVQIVLNKLKKKIQIVNFREWRGIFCFTLEVVRDRRAAVTQSV